MAGKTSNYWAIKGCLIIEEVYMVELDFPNEEDEQQEVFKIEGYLVSRCAKNMYNKLNRFHNRRSDRVLQNHKYSNIENP